MISFVANAAVDVVTALFLYVVGFHRGRNRVVTARPRADCTCGHRANYHRPMRRNRWGACGVSLDEKRGLECGCRMYTEDFSSVAS